MSTVVIDSTEMSSAEAERQMLERVLIQRILVGDVQSFCELVRPYQRSIFVRALSILGNEADAEEVVQESILKAFRNLFQFRSESRFSTWFIQIGINEARIKIRRDKRHLYESLETWLADDGHNGCGDFIQWRETPLDVLERKELCQAISKSLESLPSKYRSVLILRHVREFSTLDTAKILGISEVNVKVRLLRARMQMRAALISCL